MVKYKDRIVHFRSVSLGIVLTSHRMESQKSEKTIIPIAMANFGIYGIVQMG